MQQVSYVYLQQSQIAFRPLLEVFAFLDYVKAIKENMQGERNLVNLWNMFHIMDQSVVLL